MASERYWDVTGCCWKPCGTNDVGASRSSGIDADMAVLGVPSPAALPDPDRPGRHQCRPRSTGRRRPRGGVNPPAYQRNPPSIVR